jgi:hypothetical protein
MSLAPLSWLARMLALSLLVFGPARTALAAGERDVIHHGPALDVQIERGSTRLPLSLVNRLRAGDRVLVRPEKDTIAKGDWVLLLARVSARGNQVQSQHFDLAKLTDHAAIEITDDGQVPVIMLAPQLRNLFGLNTSLLESSRLLDEVLRADPQRFHDLQRADQINQAIQALSRGIERRVSGQQHAQAVQAAREVAARFGVRQVDDECFKTQTVNTECVATSIVANRDFVLPGAKDLSEMIGLRKGADLNSFLTAELRVLSQATEYLGSKYRDTYDFAPTFGRRQPRGSRVELFSIARFRSGSIKTAYIYVPSWFAGQVPRLRPGDGLAPCYAAGRLPMQVIGTLPLGNYWHDWLMTVTDPSDDQTLVEVEGLRFDPDSGTFRFDAAFTDIPAARRGNSVKVTLSGQFGFDPVDVDTIEMMLPLRTARQVTDAIKGLDQLAAGERLRLALSDASAGACVTGMTLETAQGAIFRSNPDTAATLDLDLSVASAGTAQLSVLQYGVAPLVVPLRIRPAAARIEQLEHADLDDKLTVRGSRLERIANIEVGGMICDPSGVIASSPRAAGDSASLQLICRGGSFENDRLPDQAIIHHRDGEPRAFSVPLRKSAAKPAVRLMSDTPTGLLVTPSAKALQWQLSPQETYLTEDSGLSLLLQTIPPYRLARSAYQLQLRVADDPRSDREPFTAALIADFSHDELRTRNPLNFQRDLLPSVVNPLEFRVMHQASQLVSDWQPIGRSVVLLPDLDKASCSPDGSTLWISGRNLDLIDGIRVDDPAQGVPNPVFAPPSFDPCPNGLCLRLPAGAEVAGRIQVRLRWVSGRDFSVRIPPADLACAPGQTPTKR